MKKLLLFFVFIFAQSYAFNHACFVPPENCDLNIVDVINHSHTSLEIQAYHLTNKSIIKAIIDAKNRGLSIRIIGDKASRKELSVFEKTGVSVWIDHNRAIAHNKVMIFDDRILETGSFNYTESAQKRNVENLIFITDQKIVNQYKNNFLRRMLVSEKLYE